MNKRYRNTAFLVELIINILVFSISCAVLVGLFGKASQLSHKTNEEATANNRLMAVVETLKVRGGEHLTEGEWVDDENLLCYFDADWNATTNADAVYIIRVNMVASDKGAGVLKQLVAVAETRDGRMLCDFETAAYSPNEEGGATA